jgi:hypothetical protein
LGSFILRLRPSRFGAARRGHYLEPRPNARSSTRIRKIISQPKPIVASVPATGADTIIATLMISPMTAT